MESIMEEKAVKVAEEFIKQREEAKVKAAEYALTEEQKAKLAEENKVKEADEVKAKELAVKSEQEEVEILDKDETQLTEEQKKKKAEILESREKEPDVNKIIKGLKDANRRIDKLVGRNKEQEFEFQKSLREKELEIAELKRKVEGGVIKPEDIENQVISEAQVKIARYIQEDEVKPREQRREMIKEEIEEWVIEDPEAAYAWIAKRELRREREIESDRQKVEVKGKATEFLQKQEDSVNRFLIKYPNAKPEKRALELKNQGKTYEEANKILSDEFPEYRLTNEIVVEHPEWMKEVHFGQLLADELGKRLTKKDEKVVSKKSYTEDELKRAVQEALEMETQRRSSIDSGIKPSGAKIEMTNKLTRQEEELKAEVDKANRRGSNLDFNKVLERHRYRATRPDLVGYGGRDLDDK